MIHMHMNEIFYALICINNHVLSCLISMLSRDTWEEEREGWGGGERERERMGPAGPGDC